MTTEEPRTMFEKNVKRMLLENFNWPISVWKSFADKEGGIDMNPEYQRGLVWDMEHKVKLIDSIVEGIGIPAILLREKEGFADHFHWEMVDGKQRISTVVGFMNDEFPYNGKVYSEHDKDSRRMFETACIGASVVRFITDKEVVELYNRVNFMGVPHS
jgi:hypothetical protein